MHLSVRVMVLMMAGRRGPGVVSRLTAGLCAHEVNMHLNLGDCGRMMPQIFSTFSAVLAGCLVKYRQKCVSLGAAISTDVEIDLWM